MKERSAQKSERVREDQKSKSLMRFKKEGLIQQENNDKIQRRVEKQLEYYKCQQDKKTLIHHQSVQGFQSLYPEDSATQKTKFKKLSPPSSTTVQFPKVPLDLSLSHSRSPSYLS